MDRPITAGELLALLQGVDPALPVMTQGCDCEGPCCGIEINPAAGGLPEFLIISRNDRITWPTKPGCDVQDANQKET